MLTKFEKDVIWTKETDGSYKTDTKKFSQ